MDQAKLLLPRLVVIAHAYANARKQRTHLTGVLNHGRQPKGYFDLFQFPHYANLTINILLLELQSMGEARGGGGYSHNFRIGVCRQGS